jgi:RNA polymerase sigma-70 factor (ECF subfamily)
MADDVRTVDSLLAEGRAAWPRLALPRDHLESHLAAHGLQPAEVTPEIARDLYLACACANRVPGAVEAFMRRFDREIRIAAARIDRSPSFCDDVKQSLSETLFVSGDTPRIAQYSGRGPLGAWVGMSARRLAGRIGSGRAAVPLDEEAMALEALGPQDDPGLFYLKKRYGEEVRQAVSDAFGALDPEDKTMMRLSLVEKMSLEEIGKVFGVNQSTISRRVANVRNAVTKAAKRQLRESLGASTEEVESIIRMVQSQVEIRFSRIL